LDVDETNASSIMMSISIHHETLIHRHRLPAGLGSGE
jgi:hypothetical protein